MLIYGANNMNKTQKLFLIGIMFLAVFFRYYKIQEMPGGLFPDEAANGLDINLMQQGHLQPFYERGNGREAMFFYMEWASTAIFGLGVWQFHIVSALIGVLSVLVCFLAARELLSVDKDADKSRATNIALLAAFLMAVSTWHTVLSRTAFRAILTPLFGALVLYLLIKTYKAQSRKNQLLLAALTGAAFALGFYTYIAFRIMVPILFMILTWPLLAAVRRHELGGTVKKYLPRFAIFTAAFLIFVFPIAYYFYHHFDFFIGRSGQVSIFNQTLYTVNGQQLTSRPPLSVVLSVFGEVTKTAILGFFTHGDLNWRQNISGYPMLSQLISPFFGVGLVVICFLGIWYFFAPNKRPHYWKYYLLTGWFWGMLLPELSTAEGIPHGLRSAGTIPPTFIITALALYVFVEMLLKLHNRLYSNWKGLDSWQYRLTTFSFKLLGVLFAVALIFQTFFLYFAYAYNEPANFYSFRSDLTPVSEYLNKYGDKTNTYLVLDKYSVQTTDYLTTVDGTHPNNPKNKPYMQEDPENSWQLQLKPGDQVVFTQSTIFDITKFKKYHPEAHLYMETRNKFNQTVLAVYKVYPSPSQSNNVCNDNQCINNH